MELDAIQATRKPESEVDLNLPAPDDTTGNSPREYRLSSIRVLLIANQLVDDPTSMGSVHVERVGSGASFYLQGWSDSDIMSGKYLVANPSIPQAGEMTSQGKIPFYVANSEVGPLAANPLTQTDGMPTQGKILFEAPTGGGVAWSGKKERRPLSWGEGGGMPGLEGGNEVEMEKPPTLGGPDFDLLLYLASRHSHFVQGEVPYSWRGKPK